MRTRATTAALAVTLITALAVPSGADDGTAPLAQPVLVFEADGLDGDAGGVVELGGVPVAALDQDVDGFATVEVPLPLAGISSGRVDVALVPGSAATEGLPGQRDHDDFAVSDVRLVLPDGTVVRDERYGEDGRALHLGDGRSLEEDPYDAFGYVFGPTTDSGYRALDQLPIDEQQDALAEAGAPTRRPSYPTVLRRRFRFDVPVDALRGAAAVDGAVLPLAAAAGGAAYAKPWTSRAGVTDIPLDDAGTDPLAAVDGSALETATGDGFATQAFTWVVDEATRTSRSHLTATWTGRTPAGHGASLYAYDRLLDAWVELDTATEAADGVTLEGILDVASTVDPDTGEVRLQVQEGRFEVEEADLAIAWLTDTQHYTERQPDIVHRMTGWIADAAAEEDIVYAVHTGDITQLYNAFEYEWETASAAFERLEAAGIPFGIVPGNHDIGTPSDAPTEADQQYLYYDRYFGPTRFEGVDRAFDTDDDGEDDVRVRYGGHFGEDNRNHYDLIETADGADLLVLYMDHGVVVGPDGPLPPELVWAGDVLEAHPDHHAVLATHQYIDHTAAYTRGRDQVFHRFVAEHENLFMVLSGHHIGAAYNVRRVPTADGGVRIVYEILHDYQGGPEGGSGYLRIVRVDLDGGQIDQQPYSPHLDEFDYGAERNAFAGTPVYERHDDYTVAAPLADRPRWIETDAVALAPLG
jgi:hypothetical protein